MFPERSDFNRQSTLDVLRILSSYKGNILKSATVEKNSRGLNFSIILKMNT